MTRVMTMPKFTWSQFFEKKVTSIKDKGEMVPYLATLIEVTWCNGKMSKTETIVIVTAPEWESA